MNNNCTNIKTSIFDWIANNTIQEPFEKAGNPIQKYIPPIFEKYCKILHPFILDLDVPESLYNEKEIQRKRELKKIKNIYDKLKLNDTALLDLNFELFTKAAIKAILNKHNMHDSILELPLAKIQEGPLKDDLKILLIDPIQDEFHNYGRIIHAATKGHNVLKHPVIDRNLEYVKNIQKVKWKDLANKYGLKFHYDISLSSFSNKFELIGFPLNLYFPSCSLDKDDVSELYRILIKYCKTNNIITQTYNAKHEAIHQICSLQKMTSQKNVHALQGGYLADESLEWILYTDNVEDLQLTILGGSSLLIDALIEESGLEVIQCPASSRVDSFSDHMN